MITGHPGESAAALKIRALRGDDGHSHVHLHVHGVPSSAPAQTPPQAPTRDCGPHNVVLGRLRRTSDAEVRMQVATLGVPKDNEHFELEDSETGEVVVILVRDEPDSAPDLPNQTSD